METHTPSNAQLAARLKERLGKIGVTDETPPLDQYVEDILDDAALLEGIATRPPANSLAPNDYRKLLQKAIDHLPTRTRPRKDAKKYLLFRLGKLWWGHHGLPPRRSVDVEAYAEGKGERGAFMDFVIEVNALLPENARLGSRPYIRELVDHINANEL